MTVCIFEDSVEATVTGLRPPFFTLVGNSVEGRFVILKVPCHPPFSTGRGAAAFPFRKFINPLYGAKRYFLLIAYYRCAFFPRSHLRAFLSSHFKNSEFCTQVGMRKHIRVVPHLQLKCYGLLIYLQCMTLLSYLVVRVLSGVTE